MDNILSFWVTLRVLVDSVSMLPVRPAVVCVPLEGLALSWLPGCDIRRKTRLVWGFVGSETIVRMLKSTRHALPFWLVRMLALDEKVG
jgi:hypothetical protein